MTEFVNDLMRKMVEEMYGQIMGVLEALRQRVIQLYCRPLEFAVIQSGKHLAGGLQSGHTVNLIGVRYSVCFWVGFAGGALLPPDFFLRGIIGGDSALDRIGLQGGAGTDVCHHSEGICSEKSNIFENQA